MRCEEQGAVREENETPGTGGKGWWTPLVGLVVALAGGVAYAVGTDAGGGSSEKPTGH